MIIRPSKPEVKIAVDRDPVKTSFEEWARPGHFSRTIAQFAELQAFAQFASALDKTSQNQLARGRRLRELLKHSQSNPLPVEAYQLANQ